jgi:hypothetical protein
VYDSYADRWVYTEFAFAVSSGGVPQAPYYQCVAVSTSGDATGTWNRYEFLVNSTLFSDYPKISVWQDGYYMSVNEFAPSGAFVGAGAIAFERSKMLAGQPARALYVDASTIDPSLSGMLPADADGPTAPAAGAAAPFVSLHDDSFAPNDRLQVWNFHVDWATPANSTFSLGSIANVAPLSTAIANVGHGSGVDAIAYGQLMYRVQWRSRGGTPTMVVNNTVDAGGGQAAIRWTILTFTAATWQVAQQGTYAPDSADRWMGSVAMDGAGDLAVGFSVGAPASTYTSLHYVGRLASDPANTLPQAEVSLVESGGMQTSRTFRWGDYSNLTVDPVDDCTFWFTGEYYPHTASYDWHTRIGSFRFPSCTSSPSGPTSTTPPGVTGSATEGAALTATTGTWSGSPAYAYRWRRCNGTTGLGCADIPGATGSTYTVRAADLGSRIRVRVTATEGVKSTDATSAATPLVVPPAQVNTDPPPVTNTPPAPVSAPPASSGGGAPSPTVTTPATSSAPAPTPAPSPSPSPLPDRVRPIARALTGSATRGKRSLLRFKLFDDSGTARAVVTLREGGKTIATLRSGFASVKSGRTYSISWKPSAHTARRGLAFCVVGTDRAGNASKRSCAPLSLR